MSYLLDSSRKGDVLLIPFVGPVGKWWLWGQEVFPRAAGFLSSQSVQCSVYVNICVPNCSAVKTLEGFLPLPLCTPLQPQQQPSLRSTGTSLGRGAQELHSLLGCSCQGCRCWATRGSVQTPVYSPLDQAWAQADHLLFLPVQWSKYLQLYEWGWQQPQNFVLDSKCHI